MKREKKNLLCDTYIFIFPIDNLGFKLIYKLKIWTWKFNLCGKHHQRNSDKYGTDKIFYFRSKERVKNNLVLHCQNGLRNFV